MFGKTHPYKHSKHINTRARTRLYGRAAPPAENITNSMATAEPAFTFADLFCGIGGFHQALGAMGGRCVFASDIDKTCREVYERNYGLAPAGDITKVAAPAIPAFDVLCAGFPCQPFSKAGAQAGFDDEKRGTLFYDIVRIARHHRPRYLLLENVANLTKHDGGRTWRVIRDTIRDLGYQTYDEPLALYALHFDVPQIRKRVLILCARSDLYLPPRPAVPKLGAAKAAMTRTVADLLTPTLPRNTLGEKYEACESVWSEFIDIHARNGLRPLSCPVWTDWWDNGVDADNGTEAQRAAYGRKSYTGWIDRNRAFYVTEHGRLFRDWLRRARATPLWKGAVRKFEWQAGALRAGDSLRTLLWTCRPSGVRVKRPDYIPTLVAMAQIPVYGPFRRKITPRELLRFQSFPADFQFDNKSQLVKQLGNTVTVRMIEGCARFLINSDPLRLGGA